ncbi:retinal-specific phospholipid-transporting ATPase ABCA4 isoform X2 [Drosophila ficusphila]|uniref:retinal-specific phospholipid-transporting ATPase ABCA4 isoform X2 n=1 Tax=Drosophila ficusphila TaxID=30025 RepID=UPI0007E6AF50|nr:retinal-specific phospholipid-transporting ATPase ABCA4 isoform X2 [Drosophila ficusphila]
MMRPHLSFRQKYQLLLWKDMKLQFASVAELVAIFILAALMPVLITIGRKVSKSLFRYEVEVEKAPGPKILDTCVFRDLYYSPYNGLVEKLVFELSNSSECFGYEGFDTTRELHLKMIENKEAAGIAFPHEWATIQTYPDYLNFTLYMPLNLKKRHSGYFESGFLMIQERLSRLFIQFKSSRGRHRKNIAKVRMNHFPYPRYVPNYYANSAIAVTYTILISFFLPCITIVKYIVAEREYQQKAVLNTMGFRNSIHWLAWYTKSMILLILCVLLILTIFAIGSIYEFSNHVCLFIVLLAYCHSLVLFAFFVSAFFSRSYWAAVLALLLYVATALPYVIVGDRHSSLASQTAACFGLNSALFYILQSVAKMEKQSVGIQWYTMAKTASRGHKLSIVAHMTIMLVTSCVELLVCLYIEEVRHGGFGVPQPWYYPFQRRYWFSRRFGLKKDPLLPISKPSARSGYFATSDDRYRSLTTEKVPIGKIPIVEVRNLNKQFKNRVVVKDLTFNMYENEITALLGHNACGKTTTILMLCGMLSPTSGTAVINGYDIVKERKFAKASLGICAQHSVLFKGLTVYDHIYFFSRLKGYATHDARMETEMYIRKLNLAAFSRVDALKLSSGNQRRLSLACALCGGSKVIFCDEPSSGLDPRGRHDLWRLLQKEKQGRAVLMTTHLMEEAEILGDRIAIMSNGELRSFGTLGFLKQIHNASFTLYVEMGLNCKLDKLTDLVTHVASASEPVIRGPDVTFKLPRNMIGKFSVLFHLLEINKKILDVVSFDFSDASLEEIILSLDPEHEPRPRGGADEDKNSFGTQTDLVDRAAARAERRRARELARQAASSTSSQAKPEPEPKEPPKSNLIRKPSEQSRPKPELTFRGRASVMGLCQAMMMKKAYYTRYHFGLFLLILFIPLIFFFIVLATSEYERGNKLIVEPTVMELSLNYYSYDDMIILLEVDDRFFKKEGQGYVEAVKKPAQVEKIKSIFAHLFKAPPLVRRDIRRKYVCGASFNDSSTITAWFNSNAFEHSAPIALNLVYEAIGKAATGSAFNIFVHRGHLDESHMAKSTLTKHRSKRQDNVDYEDYEDYEFREEDNPSINDFNKTLKNPSYNSITPSDVQIIPHMSVSESRSVFYNERESMYLIFAAIIIIIAYLALALSSFAIFVTEERVQQMKMQQDLQSLSPGCFWFTHFIWDYFICAFYMMALTLAIYQDTIWYQSLIIFLLIGFACLPFIYLCSLLFKKPATAFVMNFTIQLVTGGILFCFLFFVSSRYTNGTSFIY